VGPEDAIDRAVDMVGSGSWGQPDGETDVAVSQRSARDSR
jgi:hypothetical protein